MNIQLTQNTLHMQEKYWYIYRSKFYSITNCDKLTKNIESIAADVLLSSTHPCAFVTCRWSTNSLLKFSFRKENFSKTRYVAATL